MDWQPMSTAPMDDELVWVTFAWVGCRKVSCQYWPYSANAIAWRSMSLSPTTPEPYTGSIEDLEAIHVDPRDAEIERLRAKVDLLSALMPTDNELEEIKCTTSKNYEYADNDVINGWVARVVAGKERLR